MQNKRNSVRLQQVWKNSIKIFPGITSITVHSFGIVDFQWQHLDAFPSWCYFDGDVARYFFGFIFEGWIYN